MPAALRCHRRSGEGQGPMQFRRIASLAGVVGLTLLFASPMAIAAAQQAGQTIDIEPSTVAAPGPADLTITGTGWTAPPPILIVECTTPSSNDLSDLTVENDCETSTIEAVTPDDAGNFEVVVTFDVTADGLIVATSDVSSNLVLTAVTVAQSEGEDDTNESELARTGLESDMALAVAIVLLVVGAIAIGASRAGARRPAP